MKKILGGWCIWGKTERKKEEGKRRAEETLPNKTQHEREDTEKSKKKGGNGRG